VADLRGTTSPKHPSYRAGICSPSSTRDLRVAIFILCLRA